MTLPNLTTAQASLLAQAKDRCYPGILEIDHHNFWLDTLKSFGFDPGEGDARTRKSLADLRQAIDEALQSN